MDNLTHSLVGALLGQAGLKKKTGLAMPALIIGANLPDVDAACFFWLEGQEHLGFRRGITHGPPAMVLLPLMLAGLLWGYDRWQAKRGKRPEGRLPVHFGWLFALSLIGCLTHPALDWLNVYGVRLLEPFSSQWFYGDTLFIIDVWLWAIMGLGLWFSLRREGQGGNWTKPARVAIAASLAYIGAQGIITNHVESKLRAAEPQSTIVIASPKPIASWEREEILGDGIGNFLIDGRAVGGDVFIPNCNLSAVGETEPEVSAFLSWTRSPLVEWTSDGFFLRDARFLDPRATGRFSVAIPGWACLSVQPNYVDGKPNLVRPPEPPVE